MSLMKSRRQQTTTNGYLHEAPIAQLDRAHGFEPNAIPSLYKEYAVAAESINGRIPERYQRSRAVRDLPSTIPDEIAQIIYERYGDLKALADSCELPYTSVYSVLAKGSLRMVRTLVALAKPLRISPDRLALILLIEDVEQRKIELQDVLNGKSLNQWAREAGMSKSAVITAVNNLEQTQIKNVVLVAEALKLDLKRILRDFDRSKIAG